jgi:hypothetical protein
MLHAHVFQKFKPERREKRELGRALEKKMRVARPRTSKENESHPKRDKKVGIFFPEYFRLKSDG